MAWCDFLKKTHYLEAISNLRNVFETSVYVLLRALIQVLLIAQIMFFRPKGSNPGSCIASSSHVSLIISLEQFLSLS